MYVCFCGYSCNLQLRKAIPKRHGLLHQGFEHHLGLVGLIRVLLDKPQVVRERRAVGMRKALELSLAVLQLLHSRKGLIPIAKEYSDPPPPTPPPPPRYGWWR